MEKKRIFKTITLFTALAITIGLVTTFSVVEKEKTFITAYAWIKVLPSHLNRM